MTDAELTEPETAQRESTPIGETLPPPDPAERMPRWIRRRKPRPRWGLGDVWLGLVLFLLASVAGQGIGELFATPDSIEVALAGVSVPLVVAATSLYAQQIGQAAWPFVVARWKGLGAFTDWRLGFKLVDVPLGVGVAVIAAATAGVASAAVSALVGLEDSTEAGNTQILTDAQGTAWIWFMVYAAVVLAPVAEELFFRGLALRAFEKRGGPVVAVIGSTLVFTLLHYNGASAAATAVLFAAIAGVGTVLAIATIRIGRIWPAVFAHMLFNGLGALGALGSFEALAS